MSRLKFVLFLTVFAVLTWGITAMCAQPSASAESQAISTEQGSSVTVMSGGEQTDAAAAAARAKALRNEAFQKRQAAYQAVQDALNAQQPSAQPAGSGQ